MVADNLSVNLDDRLINEKEVQGLLGIGLSTIQQWRLKGQGPKFVKLGRLVRYRHKDVLEYINKLTSYSSTSDDAK